MTMDNRTASTYQQASAGSASPIGAIVALYDTILRDFRRALAAVAAGNVEARVFELNHALTVIAHLRSVLNHEQGKEAAHRFERFYDVTHAMLLVASMQGSREPIERLIELYGSLRAAWYEVDQQLPEQSQQLPAAIGVNSPANLQTAETPSSTFEVRRGRWSA